MPDLEDWVDQRMKYLQRHPDPRSPEEIMDDILSMPLFMTRNPTQDDLAKNEVLQAIQSLVHEGTPDEQAQNFKDHGNECFKEGKLRDAIEFYSKGLDVLSKFAVHAFPELQSTLYANRAAGNLALKNYRSVVKDCTEAVKLNPGNVKALFRCAKALLALESYEEASNCCRLALAKDPENESIKQYLTQIISEQRLSDKRRTKLALEKGEREEKEKRVLELIAAQKICCVFSDPGRKSIDFSSPYHVDLAPEAQEGRMKLCWPVVFMYPEYQENDIILSFHEDDTFAEHLQNMFSEERPSWDSKGDYLPESLEVYFESFPSVSSSTPESAVRPRLMKVSSVTTLATVLQHPGFRVVDGMPSIIIISSSFSKAFRKSYKLNK